MYERDTLTPAVPGARLPISPQELASYRSSYRCLVFQLSLTGKQARDDLYGDDRPEQVQALYTPAFAWLRAG